MRTRRKAKQSRSSRMFRTRSSRKRQRGGEKKCLFINWGPGVGIGNQLCIYAAATIIKDKVKNWDLCIPPMKNNPHTDTDYRFLFTQGRPVEIKPEIEERIRVATLVHKNKNIRHGPWKNTDLVTNSGDPLGNSTKNLRMKTTEEPEAGYYHNYGSIEPILDKIRPELQEKLAQRYKSQVEVPESSAFIHIRHGDYEKYKILSPMEYYKAAKARLEQEAGIGTIYILSEPTGIAWAKQEGLAQEAGKKIITIDDSDELKVLYIMSRCKGGACISASTYSMWGAILGPAENKSSMIIYPSKWIHISAKELSFPERWIQI